MMKLMSITYLLGGGFLSATYAQCGQGEISVVGELATERLARAWADSYLEQCANFTVVTENGGSSAGISRACGTLQGSTSVDIAATTRLPLRAEASTTDNWNFKCERSPRSMIEIDVAVEGISMAVARVVAVDESSETISEEGVASQCLEQLQGLTIPQLRWIYSSFTDEELIDDGWDPASVENLDDDPSTHTWRELNAICPDSEILIAGPAIDSGAALLFHELVFGSSSDETFATTRKGSFFTPEDNAELSAFLAANDTAIAFFDVGYILTKLDLEALALVTVIVPGEVVEDDAVVKPSAAALEAGTYPLSRIFRFLMYNDEESLQNTRGYVEHALSDAGDVVTKEQGFWPIAGSRKLLMTTRIQSESGLPKELVESYCGPAGGNFSVAGSSTVFPVATSWAEIYKTFCDVTITVEGGGSSNGAGRVCADETRGTPVEIGDMSREWKDAEAAVFEDFLYQCVEGDESRSAIQVDVAIDGLTVAIAHDGHAAECIKILGGLTTDQLRWIYSNYNDQQLKDTGWDPTSLKNSDSNSQTHKWSELHKDCSNIEIRIAGADDQSGTYEYFLETILTDFAAGETYDTNRPGFSYFNSEDDDVLVDYIFSYPESISYFGYSYFFENQESLSAVAIRNDAGKFVVPNPQTIADSSYNPLARRIYMNLLNDQSALVDTVPFVKFGLSNPEMVAKTGYVAIPEDQAQELMATRLDGAPYSLSADDSEASSGLSTGAIIGIAVGGAVFLCIVVFLIYKLMTKKSAKGEDYPEEAP